jgi:hypothetical protein
VLPPLGTKATMLYPARDLNLFINVRRIFGSRANGGIWRIIKPPSDQLIDADNPRLISPVLRVGPARRQRLSCLHARWSVRSTTSR